MAIIKLGPDVNCYALVDFADEKQVPMARHCDACDSTHHPRAAPEDGARYRYDGRWLCVACYAPFALFFLIAGNEAARIE